MSESLENYGLDMHCTMILEEYREAKPSFEMMKKIVTEKLAEAFASNGLYITAIEARVKEEKSLAGKLALKGSKYASLDDITDILGSRVITFYSDEVDKIAAMVDRLFEVDWANSVDKRKMHELDSFGYNSLHYICRIPKELYFDPEHPEINTQRFEVQMRTALQHVWATMHHDTGYKSGIEIPHEYLRNMNRLAGMLELADEQFSLIRTSINDYRRQVQNLVASGKFDDVNLDGDSFASYLKLKPFDKLTKKIATINQAEIIRNNALPYLEVLKDMFHFKTLGDIERLVKDNSDAAYEFATYQIAATDLDIISSNIAIQDLCIVHILKAEGGVAGLKRMFDIIDGESDYNHDSAVRIYDAAKQLSFMQQK